MERVFKLKELYGKDFLTAAVSVGDVLAGWFGRERD